MQKWVSGSHGGTYGGNAVAAAAATATIQTIRDEGLLENSTLRGEQLMSGLRSLQNSYPGIGDVRGKGLMVGCEFRDRDHKPDKATAKSVVQACFERRMLLLTCGPWDNTIRFIPPLICTEAQITESLDIFKAVVDEVM
jgi:4-aminobutyrate aminotransferase